MLPTAEQVLAEERLAFTDRIIGLEQQVRELQQTPLATPSEAVAMESSYALLTSTTTWRVGRVVMLPVRVLRAVQRRVIR